MPLEVTPIPFTNQQLPYAPRMPRPEVHVDTLPLGSAASRLSRGPASVAASAIILPTPGAIASPHRAIPALPDAGYTAPTFRTTSVMGSVYGSPTSGFAHGAEALAASPVYGTDSHMQLSPNPRGMGMGAFPAPGSVYSDAQPGGFRGSTGYSDLGYGAPGPGSEAWGSSSLPAHRRGMGLLQHADGRPLHHQNHMAYQHSQTDQLTSPHGPHGHAEHLALPHATHNHAADHRLYHHNHEHHHQEPHQHYDRGLELEIDQGSDASYYARPRHRARSASLLSSSSDTSDGPTNALPQRSATIHGHHHPHRHRSPSVRRRAPSMGHGHSPIEPSPLSLNHNGLEVPRAERGPGRRRSSSVDAREPHRRSSPLGQPTVEVWQGHRRSSIDGRQDMPTALRDQRYYYEEHRHGGQRERHHHEHADHPAPPPPPAPAAQRLSPSSLPRHNVRNHTHNHTVTQTQKQGHNRHRSTSGVPFPAPRVPSPNPSSSRYLAVPSESMSQLHITVPRRRAVSMTHEQHPSPLSHQVGYAGSDGGLDDAASFAGSHMTFMDGSVAGRTSQYGLPKYPHVVKPDYRRFCVQRGTADVFLD